MTTTLFAQDIQDIAAQRGIVPPPVKPRRRPAVRKKAQLVPARLRQAALDAITAYRASPEYAALLADLPTLNLLQLRQRLAAALAGPHFAPMLAVTRDSSSLLDKLEQFLDGMIPKAVSLGLFGQAIAILGVGGSVGVVTDLSSTNYKAGVYLCVSGDIGFDAGAEAAICVGFWRNAVGDLSGSYAGAETDITDLVGLDAAGFDHEDELALVFVGADLGIDDGVDGTTSYVYELDVGSEPDYQPGEATYLVQFGVLTCVNSKNGYDTVYLNFTQDGDKTMYRFPAWNGNQMCQQDNDPDWYQWNLGLIAKCNSYLTLTLHAGDYTLASTVTVNPSTFAGVGSSQTFTWNDKTDVIDAVTYTVVATRMK